jgi:hypothetical protein
MGKHLALLTDVVSGFKSFSEVPCLARKCGTHRSDSPIRALYPLVWIPYYDAVS